jgi:hypothetical protein
MQKANARAKEFEGKAENYRIWAHDNESKYKSAMQEIHSLRQELAATKHELAMWQRSQENSW